MSSINIVLLFLRIVALMVKCLPDHLQQCYDLTQDPSNLVGPTLNNNIN